MDQHRTTTLYRLNLLFQYGSQFLFFLREKKCEKNTTHRTWKTAPQSTRACWSCDLECRRGAAPAQGVLACCSRASAESGPRKWPKVGQRRTTATASQLRLCHFPLPRARAYENNFRVNVDIVFNTVFTHIPGRHVCKNFLQRFRVCVKFT